MLLRAFAAMRRLLNFVLGLLLLLAVAAGGLLWRLDRGPISLAPLQPLLQPLIDRGSPFLITYQDPTLVWLREEGAVALAVRNVEARTRAGVGADQHVAEHGRYQRSNRRSAAIRGRVADGWYHSQYSGNDISGAVLVFANQIN